MGGVSGKVAAVAFLAGLACSLQAGWIHAKALLARGLVEAAWQRTLAGAGSQAPWPWADTHPVARLRCRRLGADVLVLAGSSGRTLAFGPGHVVGTAAPGALGNAVVGGHRDTHFAFLQNLEAGDLLEVVTARGATVVYRVEGARILDRRETAVMEDRGDQRLTLVTCYPFDTVVPGGPLRYVVTAAQS